MDVWVQCCFMSTETVWTIRDAWAPNFHTTPELWTLNGGSITSYILQSYNQPPSIHQYHYYLKAESHLAYFLYSFSVTGRRLHICHSLSMTSSSTPILSHTPRQPHVWHTLCTVRSSSSTPVLSHPGNLTFGILHTWYIVLHLYCHTQADSHLAYFMHSL